jgi:cytochrome oxidase Cu insertion factor (SCO1/SenC/PrrC family)
MRFIVVALCVLMVAVLIAVPADAAYQVGDTVGDFTLNDANGTPVSLFDYQGKVVWITFWRFG